MKFNQVTSFDCICMISSDVTFVKNLFYLLHLFIFFCYHIRTMAIDNEKNKRMIITIPRELYAQLEKVAEDNTRSVSGQALHYIRLGLIQEKRGK